MQKYFLVNILKRKNKEKNTEYYLAYFILSTENSCDLMNILITPEQVEVIKNKVMTNYDFSRNIQVEYNSYQKKYIPKLVLDNQK